ncbi:hypothetical protein C440_04653 [Haloferax mucosum ATCC BAA-1512]|uniref:Uncharacterized protein n=1 Tax=Haloferax mucosum ATCC BAA-1512 TaxID=662479 RepID=M0IMH7_9EURY|nr:hypothetical protein [Haloferax mucosum]ELZ97038.1 hypothetical protein C440_04653 [Haloferax mucosum ATCC BAA-1512]
MSLLGITLVAGVVSGIVLAGIVYAHATHGNKSPKARRLSPLLVAGADLLGFFGAYVFEDEVRYLYFRVIKPRAIAVTPYEALSVTLGSGLLVGIGALVSYLALSRNGTV